MANLNHRRLYRELKNFKKLEQPLPHNPFSCIPFEAALNSLLAAEKNKCSRSPGNIRDCADSLQNAFYRQCGLVSSNRSPKFNCITRISVMVYLWVTDGLAYVLPGFSTRHVHVIFIVGFQFDFLRSLR